MTGVARRCLDRLYGHRTVGVDETSPGLLYDGPARQALAHDVADPHLAAGGVEEWNGGRHAGGWFVGGPLDEDGPVGHVDDACVVAPGRRWVGHGVGEPVVAQG